MCHISHPRGGVFINPTCVALSILKRVFQSYTTQHLDCARLKKTPAHLQSHVHFFYNLPPRWAQFLQCYPCSRNGQPLQFCSTSHLYKMLSLELHESCSNPLAHLGWAGHTLAKKVQIPHLQVFGILHRNLSQKSVSFFPCLNVHGIVVRKSIPSRRKVNVAL